MADKKAQVTLRHGETLHIMFAKRGDLPPQAALFAPAGPVTAHKKPQSVQTLPYIVFRFFDLGTHHLVALVREPTIVLNEFGGYDIEFTTAEKNSFQEIFSEMRPQPDRVERSNYERRLLDNFGKERTWNTLPQAKPRIIENNYQLNVDTNTSGTNLLVEIDGERGAIQEPISIGNPNWKPIPDINYQLEALEALTEKEEEFPFQNSGLGPGGGIGGQSLLDPDGGAGSALQSWKSDIESYRYEPWDANLFDKILKEGQLRKPVSPGKYTITCSSEYVFEHFSLADRARYSIKAARGFQEGQIYPTPQDPGIEPPIFRINSQQSVRADIFLVPQIHRYVTRWLAVYVLIAWFIIVLLYYPTIRSFGLRAGFYPEYYVPEGNPDIYNFVGIKQSFRIQNTMTYAAAIVADAQFVDELSFAGRVGTFLIGRIQGEYKIYLRHYEPDYLVAIIREYIPREQGREEALEGHTYWYDEVLYYVFRKVRIERTLIPAIELNGLFTQEVVPWIPNYFESSARHHTERPGEGI